MKLWIVILIFFVEVAKRKARSEQVTTVLFCRSVDKTEKIFHNNIHLITIIGNIAIQAEQTTRPITAMYINAKQVKVCFKPFS